jgi:NAD(P)H-hydrate epimerase
LSRKGENGMVAVIGGSRQYHGAPILAVRAANRFCDLVYFHSPFGLNNALVKRMKFEVAEVIVVDSARLARAVERSDCVLIGNGMAVNANTKRLVNGLLKKFWGKKFVLDAAALHVVDKKLLSPRVGVTPHAGEFKALFGVEASAEQVFKQAKKYGCVVLLKRPAGDFISDGKRLFVNETGNAGMTKGGTGDCLAGLLAALACKNDLLTAACAAAFANGAAGDLLLKEKGFNYNASDLIEALPRAFKR